MQSSDILEELNSIWLSLVGAQIVLLMRTGSLKGEEMKKEREREGNKDCMD